LFGVDLKVSRPHTRRLAEENLRSGRPQQPPVGEATPRPGKCVLFHPDKHRQMSNPYRGCHIYFPLDVLYICPGVAVVRYIIYLSYINFIPRRRKNIFSTLSKCLSVCIGPMAYIILCLFSSRRGELKNNYSDEEQKSFQQFISHTTDDVSSYIPIVCSPLLGF